MTVHITAVEIAFFIMKSWNFQIQSLIKNSFIHDENIPKNMHLLNKGNKNKGLFCLI